MVIEIPKGTAENKIRDILKKRKKQRRSNKAVNSFFGKLPRIDNGLAFQKKVRNEWK